MIAYFDASAFVKLVIDEPGRSDAREVFGTARLVQSSWLLVPETYGALARATRARRFAPAGAARAYDVLRGLLDEVEALELDRELADRAGELAASLGLRGGDAVHLASYERIESDATVLVAADGELARAARSLGCAIATPGGA